MVVTRTLKIGMACFACLLAGGAIAQENRLNSEFSVFGGVRLGGEVDVDESNEVYEADDASSFGIIWNTDHSRETEWEVYFSRQQTDFELSDPLLVVPVIELEMYTLQLGGTYLFDGAFYSDTVQPYMAMTAGGTHIKSDADGGDSDTFFSGSIGLGLKFRRGERLGFRLEGRLHATLIDDSSRVFCSVGPVENVCAVDVEGDALGQFEAFAGISFRF
jgi:hypothetical protein